MMRLYKNVSDSNKMIEIEYELNNSGSLLRKINTSTNDSYPYIFDDTWDNVKTITSDIEIENIFTDLNLADTNNQRYIKVDLTIPETIDLKI
ncbi:MAG: hypothetical protein U5K53_07880 [Halanaerobiales bacterium]|nr:hypothetical protein [Halanaerobiales bacterium]